jgi:hypothetical protein
MANTAFPALASLPELSEQLFTGLLASALGDFVVSGLTVPASSVNLNLTVAAGVALLSGYRLNRDSEVVAISGAGTWYLRLAITRDATPPNGNLATVGLVVSASATTPADQILLAYIVATGSAITLAADRRVLRDSGGTVPAKLAPPISASVSLGSTGQTTIASASGERGTLLSIGIEDAATVGSYRLRIDVDGQTGDWINVRTTSTGEPFFSRLAKEVRDMTGTLRAKVVDINVPYSASFAVVVDVTATGAATAFFSVLRTTTI